MISGSIRKLESRVTCPISYSLPVGGGLFPLNDQIGKKIALTYRGFIRCLHCKTKIKKSYQQGYCYRCFTTLAACDRCITSPERCHYHRGTCREPDWANRHCFIPHTVYLSNTSGVKVGITRTFQQKTRWIDQGAIQALPIAVVNSRADSGKAEIILKKLVPDRTHWRKMLAGPGEPVDMEQKRWEMLSHWPREVKGIFPPRPSTETFTYPVRAYPEKIIPLSLDKQPSIHGVLLGVKGQYLLFKDGVFNVRKHAGYDIIVEMA